MQIYSLIHLDNSRSGELAPQTAPIKPKAQWRPTRVGVGEYFHPIKHPKALLYGRFEFLRKIEALAPEVLKSLASVVRMHYEPLRREIDSFQLLTLKSENLRQNITEGKTSFLPLNTALQSWCDQFYLDADWVRDFALNTLYHWTGDTIIVKESHGWTLGGSIADEVLSESERAFSYSHSGWEMTYTTKNDFIRQMRADFESRLAGYVHTAEEKAKADGWKKTPALRKADKRSDVYRHVEWLVRWQIQQWETSRIADEYGLGKKRKTPQTDSAVATAKTRADERTRKSQSGYKSVHDAINKAAKLIELPLRRAKSTYAPPSAS